MAFFFSREGPAEELADAPEVIEMHVVLWHVARCTGAEDLVGAAEDFVGGAEDFEGAGAAWGIGREGIAEELGHEGIEGEALGLSAGFLAMAFFGLLAEASAAVAAAAESSLNFLTASFACLASLAWRFAHSSA